VSTGAACSSGTLEPSPVLRALGQAPAQAREALRISVGKDTTNEDVDALLAALPEILERVRGAEVDPAGWREVELR
jgi:cysteine desulfurase